MLMMMSKIKVGDKIRIYSNADVWTGVVEKIYPNDHLDYISDDDGLLYGSHIKQCRKLVKKTPREWWINTKDYEFDSMFGTETGVMCRSTEPENTDDWIRVREVKKK